MALNKSMPPVAPVVAASQKERVAKPIKQTTVAQKEVQPSPKRKVTHVARKQKEDAPTFSSGLERVRIRARTAPFQSVPVFLFWPLALGS
jgi:hypothetical protein